MNLKPKKLKKDKITEIRRYAKCFQTTTEVYDL